MFIVSETSKCLKLFIYFMHSIWLKLHIISYLLMLQIDVWWKIWIFSWSARERPHCHYIPLHSTTTRLHYQRIVEKCHAVLALTEWILFYWKLPCYKPFVHYYTHTQSLSSLALCYQTNTLWCFPIASMSLM